MSGFRSTSNVRFLLPARGKAEQRPEAFLRVKALRWAAPFLPVSLFDLEARFFVSIRLVPYAVLLSGGRRLFVAVRAQASAEHPRRERAWAMPCPAADRPAPQARLPHTGPDTAGTAAPTSPKPPRPPSSTAAPPPSGSIRPETSASCGPVATLPGSSIRLPSEAENRTTRVLPNPDNSCAIDTSFFEILAYPAC